MKTMRIAMAAAAAGLLSAAALAAETPACDDADLGNYVKKLAADVTVAVTSAPGDQAVADGVIAGLTLSNVKEDSFDAAALTRVCYADIESSTVRDFEGGGLVYTVVGAPGTPDGVQVKLDVVPKR